MELLWILEATVDRVPELETLLEDVVDSDLFSAEDLPEPYPEERDTPKGDDEPLQLTF